MHAGICRTRIPCPKRAYPASTVTVVVQWCSLGDGCYGSLYEVRRNQTANGYDRKTSQSHCCGVTMHALYLHIVRRH
ncbi:hypothetical protein AVEN_198089-1, partial [Araneus ventricosus]